MAAVKARKVDVVVVAAFDRFGRSVRHLVESLELFRHLGVAPARCGWSSTPRRPGGVRLRVARLVCTACRAPRSVWFRLGQSALH